MNSPEANMFLDARPRLFAAAYRMLGTVSDTEDILQEVYLRWQTVAMDTVRDPVGYLMRITTRLCLDQLKSARVKREVYPGEWLPEPVLTDDSVEALDHDVSVALLLALERLTPLERVAFLLHDVFDCDYDEVALTLGRSEASCRQLTTRARRHVQESKPRAAVDDEQGAAMVEAFFMASKSGDTSVLAKLLTEDVQLISDGGGKAIAALNPIVGQDHVVRFFEGLSRKLDGFIPKHWKLCQLNGLPAIVSREIDGIVQTTALEIVDGKIHRIYVVRNPDKTQHLVETLNDDEGPRQ
ncbi:sigma-70 family RNA polymerase sigma factor [Parasedimentitalea huanghaiensis]|uniref:Sigma-70 family RNA polymerase sigma factor n=1 Tax=Parasedimentitalea huanghaiensis TaxID=2682100 RepID=A0A6L6WCM1_9RHOB|nr:sigma-70 family RNA polymerase sigma factor [Zongyanglinia huanghaiensis]MVO15300.1 sigma-70 family RNA polymerase sigma factor [Zongyanglinia huanghaiensis]